MDRTMETKINKEKDPAQREKETQGDGRRTRDARADRQNDTETDRQTLEWQEETDIGETKPEAERKDR